MNIRKINRVILAICATIIIGLATFACTDKEPKDHEIVGTWTFYSLTAKGSIAGISMDTSFTRYEIDNQDITQWMVYIQTIYTFNNDGTFHNSSNNETIGYRIEETNIIMLNEDGSDKTAAGIPTYQLIDGELIVNCKVLTVEITMVFLKD